nr:RNA-directed DNA polymerase, eukaryota, reverse transcriptase zinc-binding domain protein [Tanacetum cinerariifolium]
MTSQKNVKEKYKIDLEAVEGIIDSGKVEGDENSSFFHGTLSKKQSILSVRGIMVDGLWIDDPRLSTNQHIELESKVSNEEIKRVVWDCGTEKAPGPDGFTFGFYRQFWYLIENGVYNVVKYFFLHGEIPKGCNSSFIALISKIPSANVVKDFRPISLIGSLYKIIAKILANRLVGKLGEIVNEVQSAFIADRQILDDPFILDELIQWCKRKKKQLLVFKVDFEKAYYSVRWDFLDDIIRKFGFGDKCLHLSFQCVEEAGMFKGIKLDNSVSISHMFYADDALFVGQCDKIKGVASKLGCLTFKTPFMYLGSIVGGSMSRIQAWADVVDRVSSRLSKWKMNILSIGGRLTLLKSILGSMPILHMSIFKAPLGVLRKLETIRSHFFNGFALNCNKSSWVNWKTAVASKEKGGLSISSLYALNMGLMFKWFWRFCTQDTSLWSRVIKAIYGETGSVDGNVNFRFKTCWMNIVQEVNSLVGKGIDLRKFICFKLGNGEKTRFWDDRWLDGESLKMRFPRVYSLELCKDITVASKVTQHSLVCSLRRRPRGGVEQQQFEELLTLTNGVRLVPMGDRWTWKLSSSGEFSVASVRRLIDDKTLPVAAQKTRWVRYVPIKVNVIAWKVKSNSLPTRFNISRRGIPLDSIKCGICDTGVETVSHLFFSCDLVRQLVRLIAR